MNQRSRSILLGATWLIYLCCPAAVHCQAEEPIVIADFENSTYGEWQTSGKAFGDLPATGSLPGQMNVEGFLGTGLVNSFHGGDDAKGTLTSPTLKIERRFLTFLIGGGGWEGETCINLLIDNKVVRTATGTNTVPGGSERLQPLAWDVDDLLGREVTIAIVDQRAGGWGHINVDHIVQTNDLGNIALAAPPEVMLKNAHRVLQAEKSLLHFPVATGGNKRNVVVFVDDQPVRRFAIELADEPQWWAPLDIDQWKGKQLRVVVDELPERSTALQSLRQSDSLIDNEQLYAETLRSQLHFSPRRGWMNDPNGLVFYNNEYHLFYQHNPYGWNWGNMHWGQATSHDLVHWQEQGEALYPDDLGTMFSGSAVVDWQNTSGFGKDGQPPLVLIYTAAGNPTTQCIAYSNDGRKFIKFDGNPVLPQITGGNRDPKVIWHEPTKSWVMVLYVQLNKTHTTHFFKSTNLRDWTLASVTEGGIDADKFLFECPDFFELTVDGDANNKKWVLTAANSEYSIGTFDGTHFTAEQVKLPGVYGQGFYAPQTFSDTPDDRRIQIGWCQAPSPGMSFNQLQSLPSVLTLRSTPDGIRLHRQPVRELVSLRESFEQSNELEDFSAELIELRVDFKANDFSEVQFDVRGAKIAYDATRQEIVVNNQRAPAPFVNGQQQLIVYVDRTMIEVFASDGLTYLTLPFIPKPEERAVVMNVAGGTKNSIELQVYALKSIWHPSTK